MIDSLSLYSENAGFLMTQLFMVYVYVCKISRRNKVCI